MTNLNNVQASIKSALIAQIVEYKEQVQKVVTVSGTVKNPKTGKGQVVRRKVTTVLTGIQVVDTQATVLARRLAEKGIDTVASTAAVKACKEVAQRLNDLADNALFVEEQNKYQQELAELNQQLDKYAAYPAPHRSHFKSRAIAARVGAPSGGAIRNAVRRERGIAQAKRMVAKAIVAKYSVTSRVDYVSQAQVVSTPAFGTAISSIYQMNIVCSANNNDHASSEEILAALGRNAVVQNEDSPATAESIEVTGNLSKHSQTTQTNTVSNDTDETMLATTFANLIFAASSKSLRTDISEKVKAKKEAERMERRTAFISAFETKLLVPAVKNLLIMSGKGTKRAMAKPSNKLASFFSQFHLYGVDTYGNPQDVVFARQEIKAASKEIEGQLVNNAQAFFAKSLAYATHQLTPSEKVEFCRLIHKGHGRSYQTTPYSVTISGIEFNFANGTVKTSNQLFEANPILEIDGENFEGAHGVFMLALSCFGASSKAVGVLVSRATCLFKRDENYGAKLGRNDLAYGVANNLHLTIKVVPSRLSNKFPFFGFVDGKQDERKLTQILNSGEVAVVDKYNMKWVATGVGAEAVLVGRSEDTIFNMNDANKTAKVYNRPASIKYTFANVAGRQQSNFAVALSNGENLYSCGKQLRTIFSNSRFGHGSGVSVINPNTTFDYVVPKALRGVFNILTLPASMRAGKTYESVCNSVLSNINNKITNAIGNVYGPGESVLEFKLNDTKHTLLHNNAKAVDLCVTGGRAVVSSEYEIDIKLDVEIVGSDEQFVKLRGIGKKCTTLPYAINGIDEEWDILLNIEAVKGNPALVEMYAASFGEDCFYNSNTGILTTPDGDVNLTEKSNAFTEWATSNATETIISFEMARSTYEAHTRIIAPHAANSLAELQSMVGTGAGKDVFVEDVNDTTVIVHERIHYIIGNVVFDVEVATPKESVSTTNLTLEAANGLLLQDRELGEAVMADMLPKLSGANSLVESFMKMGGLPTFNVKTQQGRDGIAAAFKTVPSQSGRFVNHRTVLNELRTAFPNGFVVECPTQSGKISFEIHPCALAAFGGFTGNGSATREVADVIDFIYFITDTISGEGSVDKIITKLCGELSNTLKWWSANLVSSSSVMKKFTRSGSLIGGKVRTTYSPICCSRVVYGPDCKTQYVLPVVAINPTGPIAKFLGVESGNVVGITRTPMPFMTACIVTLSDEVPVGHIFVAPQVWHKANDAK